MSGVIARPGDKDKEDFVRRGWPVAFVLDGGGVTAGVPDDSGGGFQRPGQVWLVAAGGDGQGRREKRMKVYAWTPNVVVAEVPEVAPGRPEYRARIQTRAGQEFLVPLTIYDFDDGSGYEPAPDKLKKPKGGGHPQLIEGMRVAPGTTQFDDDVAFAGSPVVFLPVGEDFGEGGRVVLAATDADPPVEEEMKLASALPPIWSPQCVVGFVPEHAPGGRRKHMYLATVAPEGGAARSVLLRCRVPVGDEDSNEGYPPFRGLEKPAYDAR